jgi:hypothetical protein
MVVTSKGTLRRTAPGVFRCRSGCGKQWRMVIDTPPGRPYTEATSETQGLRYGRQAASSAETEVLNFTGQVRRRFAKCGQEMKGYGLRLVGLVNDRQYPRQRVHTRLRFCGLHYVSCVFRKCRDPDDPQGLFGSFCLPGRRTLLLTAEAQRTQRTLGIGSYAVRSTQ